MRQAVVVLPLSHFADSLLRHVTSLSVKELEALPLAQRIRAVRGGQTQQEFARQLRVSTRTVMRWESGSAPNDENTAKLAEKLDLPRELFRDQPAARDRSARDELRAEREALRAEWDAFRDEIRTTIRDEFADMLARVVRKNSS